MPSTIGNIFLAVWLYFIISIVGYERDGKREGKVEKDDREPFANQMRCIFAYCETLFI